MASFSEQVRQLKQQFRIRIFRSEWSAGICLDEKELRTEFQATYRALRKALADLAQEGLLVRKPHLGTFVASELPTAVCAVLPRVHSLGVLSSLSEKSFRETDYLQWILKGVQASLHPPANIKLISNAPQGDFSIDELPKIEPEALRLQVQGILAIEANNAQALNDLVRAQIPVTAVDFIPSDHCFDVIWIDQQEAGYLATEHLIRLGHRRIAFVGEGARRNSSDPAWQARLAGYQHAMAVEAGESPSQWVVDVSRTAGYISPRVPPFHKRQNPSAYVLASGGFFEPMRKVLGEMGLSCPAQISLASADPGVRRPRIPELSSARADLGQAGRASVELLASRLGCPAMPPVRRVLPVTFHGMTSSRQMRGA